MEKLCKKCGESFLFGTKKICPACSILKVQTIPELLIKYRKKIRTSQGIKFVRFECEICNKKWLKVKNAKYLSYQHSLLTGHKVIGETITCFAFYVNR